LQATYHLETAKESNSGKGRPSGEDGDELECNFAYHTRRDSEECQERNSSKAVKEEGRGTDDEIASCSDHVSMEGSNSTDETRTSSGYEVPWPCTTFGFLSDRTGPPKLISNPEVEVQMKLARLLLSKSKVCCPGVVSFWAGAALSMRFPLLLIHYSW
jgi:hypothetical protein